MRLKTPRARELFWLLLGAATFMAVACGGADDELGFSKSGRAASEITCIRSRGGFDCGSFQCSYSQNYNSNFLSCDNGTDAVHDDQDQKLRAGQTLCYWVDHHQRLECRGDTICEFASSTEISCDDGARCEVGTYSVAGGLGYGLQCDQWSTTAMMLFLYKRILD